MATIPTRLGAGLALAVMAGAIFSHLTVLGIEAMGDGGELFGLGIAGSARGYSCGLR